MHRFLIFAVFAAATAGAQVDLGYRLNSHELVRPKAEPCFTSPSQTFPCVSDLALGGVTFNVVSYDDRRRVRYLFTTDRNFSTKTGLHVGDWVEVDEKDVELVPGWHICGPRTADGWRVVFGADGSDTGQSLKYEDGTTVNVVHTLESLPKRGRLQIVGFEKGEV